MNFQAHLENMLEMMQDEFVAFFLGGIVIQLLCSITLGILSGPLMGGYLLIMVNWLRSGTRAEFNDIFCGMKRFGELFPLFFLMLLILAGYMLFVLPGVLMSVWWLYVPLYMADKKMTLSEAMGASRARVTEKGFFMHLVFLLMITVIPLMLVTMVATVIPPLAILQYGLFPLQCACLASLYLEQCEGLDPADRNGGSGRRPEIEPPPTSSAPPPPPPPPPDENQQRGPGRIGQQILPA